MEFRPIDFSIGFFLMNAMPHLLVGLLKRHFLFSSSGNLLYSGFNLLIFLVLFHIAYGIQTLINHGIILGALTIIVLYPVSKMLLPKLYVE